MVFYDNQTKILSFFYIFGFFKIIQKKKKECLYTKKKNKIKNEYNTLAHKYIVSRSIW